MKYRFAVALLLFAAVVQVGPPGYAQGIPTATLTGRVSNDALALPGVSVTARSPKLQGSRTAITRAGGDYAMPNLPPGEYTVTFEMSGFTSVVKPGIRLSAAQELTLDVNMAVSGVAESVTVTASKETISETAQSATSYTAQLIDKLPTTRTLLSSVVLTPGVTTNGPNGNVTIAGSMSFENLFTINGVATTENIRGTPYNLFIEDAIQETTTSVSAISAEYGRFTGGIINAITKSGGNRFSGSFRTSLENDAWLARSPNLSVRDSNYVPPASETIQPRAQSVNPRYEVTIGGPILKDRVWFFGAGRLEKISGTAATLRTTNLQYETGSDERRYEGKLTITPFDNHTVTAAYSQIDQEQLNYSFPSIPVMDFESVYDRQNPQKLLAFNYNGVLTSSFFVEAQYSRRKFTFENSGSRFTDLIKGTVVRDRARGTAYNSPIFCGVCSPEERNNDNYLIKGSLFLSSPSLGSHNIAFGYDDFGGQRLSNNYQSGSSYHVFGTTSIIRDGVVYPQWLSSSNTLLVYYPISTLSQGSDIRTRSVFVNDAWRLNNKLSFNVGIRWDKNDATDSFGSKTAKDSAFSPRLSAAFDPTGDGKIRFLASYARYVAAPAENQASAGSPAGSPATYQWIYRGPAINSNANAPTLTTTADALAQIFAFYGVTGPGVFPNIAPDAASVPGVNLKIVGSLDSPNVNEYSVGVSGSLLGKGSFRVDAVYREYADFYGERVDMTTGKVTNSLNQTFDFRAIENTDAANRKYVGLHTSFAYRFSPRFNLGGNWSWSHAYGNFEGETSGSGPVRFGGGIYPEYTRSEWNTPQGDLSIDQRHRIRLYASYDLPFVPEAFGTFNFSGIQSIDTGVPYGAAGTINSTPYVTNPGYTTPPTAGVTYWFTARDAFRTPTVLRTDLSLNYSKGIGPVEIFIQPQVLNVFNSSTVTAVDQAVLTAASTGGGNNRFVAFNPFTTAPVQRPNGDTTVTTANWDYGPNFGRPTAFPTATSLGSFQTPRTFRVSMGIRF